MTIVITTHAKERMEKYEISLKLLTETLENPDQIFSASFGRKIFQKRLNGYVLRAIVEETNILMKVITVYKAKWERYEIQI